LPRSNLSLISRKRHEGEAGSWISAFRALAFGGPQDLLTKVGKHAMDELTIDAGTPIEWLDETPATRPMPN
jgi:hypothetical protein